MSYFKQLFTGRISRLNYWAGNLLLTFYAGAMVYGLPFLYSYIFQSQISENELTAIKLVTIGIGGLFGYSFALRRAHDIGKSWQILFRYGIRDFINGLKLTYAKGDSLNNEFGEVPDSKINLRELLCIKKNDPLPQPTL